MGFLNKLISFLVKFSFIIIGLAIAIVPVIYIFGHQSINHQSWNDKFQAFSVRTSQIEKVVEHKITNIYLREGVKKLSWRDVNQTLVLADFISYEIEQKGGAVVKKILQFKQPTATKKSKKSQATSEIEVIQSSILQQTPKLGWLKDLLEQHISFEHQSLKQKQWVIVILGELDSKIANQIDNFIKEGSLYKFVIVSTWPISSKIIDIVTLPFEGVEVIEQISQIEEDAEVGRNDKEEKRRQKDQKGKKDRKFKVKQVKEEKIEEIKGAQQNGTNEEDQNKQL